MVTTKTETICLSEIDTNDHTCLLDPSVRPVTTLVQSIEAIGLINPPLVATRKNGGFGIVCGFRRIDACRILEWKEIEVRILREEYAPFELLQYAIWDNRSHRPLNVVEQARAIDKLNPFTARETRLVFFSSLLGFPPNKKVFQKITRIGLLPETVQLGILEEKLSFEAGVSLGKLSPEEAVLLFFVLANLKMSQNKQKEFITMVREIAIMEDIEISDVLCSLGIDTILERPELNRNEKSGTIRKRLKARRFPTLARAETRFKKTINQLNLPKNMHITPPPYFEGQTYVLRLDFKGLEDLDNCRKRLDALVTTPATKKLLEEGMGFSNLDR